jgi:hypothetical protein
MDSMVSLWEEYSIDHYEVTGELLDFGSHPLEFVESFIYPSSLVDTFIYPSSLVYTGEEEEMKGVKALSENVLDFGDPTYGSHVFFASASGYCLEDVINS